QAGCGSEFLGPHARELGGPLSSQGLSSFPGSQEWHLDRLEQTARHFRLVHTYSPEHLQKRLLSLLARQVLGVEGKCVTDMHRSLASLSQVSSVVDFQPATEGSVAIELAEGQSKVSVPKLLQESCCHD